MIDRWISNVVDGLFFIDIFVNILSAYERPGTNTYEVRIGVLARDYLMGWFAIDLIACIPVDVIQYVIEQFNSDKDDRPNNLTMTKLARLPRIYRVIRIVRIFKILKIFKHTKGLGRLIAKLKLNSGMNRVIKFIAYAFVLLHILACIWYLQARLQGHGRNTWTFNMELVDQEFLIRFVYSYYWAYQTLTTVGYGDFSANNMIEYSLNIIWMVTGVIFYSILVASVTSNITAETSHKDNLSKSLKALEDFAKETNLEDELATKIRQFLLNNQEDLFSKVEEEHLLNELPISLKEEVLYYQHGFLVDTIKMLQESEENEFVWALVQQT